MTAPFRVELPAQMRLREKGGDTFKDYLGRLLKMIPAEVVGIYTIGAGVIPASNKATVAIWAAICLALVVIVRVYGTADPSAATNRKFQPKAVLVASVAFVIWIYTQSGGPFAQYGMYVPHYGSLAVLVWSFVIPIFYKGD